MQEKLEALLSRALKSAEQAEVFWMDSRELPVRFEANRLKMLQGRQSTTVSLRLIHHGRLGFSSGNRPEEGEALVERALEVAAFGPAARFSFPEAQVYPEIPVYDVETEQVAVEEMLHLGQTLIDQLRGDNAALLCEAHVGRTIQEVLLLNSRGGQAGYRKSHFRLGMEGTLVQGSDMLFVGDALSSCRPVRDATPISATVRRQLAWAQRLAPGPQGRVPVIFTPQAVRSALMAPLSLGFNGRTVLQGTSPVGHRRGEQAFDPRLSVWDDGTIPYAPGSQPCDGEGVPARRTALIERGEIANFYYDLQTAGMAKTASTGNGGRGAGGPPTASLNALVIGEGDATLEAMIADIGDGLLVEELMGATQGNVLGGFFSGNVLLGYCIQRGEIVGRVKDVMVAGNIYEPLRELRSLGREGRWVGEGLYTPPIALEGVAVASKR